MTNFSYLLTPLHEHFDLGFGATANAFKSAADKLSELVPAEGPMFNDRLPINYLYRHAIELFLKSAIVITHRRLRLPYGDRPFDGEPYVQQGGGWKSGRRVHSVAELWKYVHTLFVEQSAFFGAIKTVDWSFPAALDGWIKAIEEHDPHPGVFFRYPDPTAPESDEKKALTAQMSPETLLKQLTEARPGGVTLAIHDETGTLLRGYYYTGDGLAELAVALRDCASFWYNNHAALRSQVCGGC